MLLSLILYFLFKCIGSLDDHDSGLRLDVGRGLATLSGIDVIHACYHTLATGITDIPQDTSAHGTHLGYDIAIAIGDSDIGRQS